MVRPRWHTLLPLLAVLWIASVPATAQRTSATIRGTVTDVAAAPLPGSGVRLSSVETGFERSTLTNSAGVFFFGDLPVGDYEIRVELDGFKVAVVTAIGLNVADVRQVDVVLEAGAFSEEITTVSSELVVEAATGELASLVTGEQVRELPLNGRNFTQLTQLMPGVSFAEIPPNFTNKGPGGTAGLSISGGAVTANLWTVDGVNNNDVGSNAVVLVYPSVDAIEEFKVHRSSYGAEFGGAAGAQINLVTRSGTNRFRGSAYLFYRDDSLNEKNFFLEQSGGSKEDFDRRDFGFTLGGPLVRDKLHFFVSQEWNNETRGTVRTAVVPTAAERRGDFSTSVPACTGPPPIDPLTGQAFPGGVIPADRISDAGAKYLELYSLPNTDGDERSCTNWVAAVPSDIEWRQTAARLDWTASESSQVMLRFIVDTWTNSAPNAGASGGLWGDDPFPVVDSSWRLPAESIVLQLNNVIGSAALNSLSLSHSGNDIDITRGGENAALNAEINTLIPTFFPESGKTNGVERSHPVYFGGATGGILQNIAPWSNDLEITALKDDFETVFGQHWLKVGALYRTNKKIEPAGGSSRAESPQFWGGTGLNGWGATTGNRIADILLEDMTHGYQESASLAVVVLEWDDVELYISDTWRPHPSLTLDVGVRYSLFEWPHARDDAIAAFYTSLWNPDLGNATCNGMAQVPGTDPCAEAGLAGGGEGVNRTLVRRDTDNFAPRLGLAWDVTGGGDSVLRAGFGQFHQRERIGSHIGLAAQPPFIRNTAGIRRLDEPGGPFLTQAFGIPTQGLDPDNETPYSLQFNVTWEQRLSREITLELGYVGNRGRHLLRISDINQIPAGDGNGNGVSDRLEFIRGNGMPADPVRPYFSGSLDSIFYFETNGKSEYDAFQTQLLARFGRGSQAQVSYTWSRFRANESLDSPAPPFGNLVTDRDDPALDWGSAGPHRDHSLNASLIWNLPTLEGRGGALRTLFGNWSLGGVLLYSTGAPLTAYNGTIPGLPDGQAYGTGFNFNQRPLRVPGVACEGRGRQVLRREAFTLDGLRLADTSQGAGRGICEGPSFSQLDLAFYKRFRITERFDAQIRLEVFNVLDEVNFFGVDTVLDPFNVGLDAPLNEASHIVSAEIPASFGQAHAASDPRQIQLGLKLTF